MSYNTKLPRAFELYPAGCVNIRRNWASREKTRMRGVLNHVRGPGNGSQTVSNWWEIGVARLLQLAVSCKLKANEWTSLSGLLIPSHAKDE